MASAEAAEDAVAASATLPARHFTYEQATGRMFLTEAGENELMAAGYSGSPAHGGKNNPQAQCEEDIGPIPRGVYKIGRPRKGPTPFSLPLTPTRATRCAAAVRSSSMATRSRHQGQRRMAALFLLDPIGSGSPKAGLSSSSWLPSCRALPSIELAAR